EIDEGAFVLDYFSPGGTALAETDRQVHLIERILMGTPEITGTSRRLGAELGLFATEQNRGDIVARLKPEGDRSRSTGQVADEVSGALLGVQAGEVRLDDRAVGVRVRAPDSVRFDPGQLGAIPVFSAQTRATVPLASLATFQPNETRGELLRENQQQMIA